MSSFPMTSGLASTWVTTVDSRGRRHLEARWSAPGAASAPPVPVRPVAPVVTHAA